MPKEVNGIDHYTIYATGYEPLFEFMNIQQWAIPQRLILKKQKLLPEETACSSLGVKTVYKMQLVNLFWGSVMIKELRLDQWFCVDKMELLVAYKSKTKQ